MSVKKTHEHKILETELEARKNELMSLKEAIKDFSIHNQKIEAENKELRKTAEKNKSLENRVKSLEKTLTSLTKPKPEKKEPRTEKLFIRCTKMFLANLDESVKKMGEKYPEKKYYRFDILDEALKLFMQKNRIRKLQK